MKRILLFCSVAAFSVITGADVSHAQVRLNLQTGVQLNWPTVTNDNYQVQWSSGSGWNNLGGIVSGSGTINSLYDMAAHGTRQYQVLQIIPPVAASTASPTNGGFEIGNGTNAANGD